MEEKRFPVPELEEALESLADIIINNSEFGSIVVRERSVVFRKAYGEVIFKLLWDVLIADVKEFNKLSPEQLEKAGEAIIKSGNIKKTYKFIELFRGFPNFPKGMIEKAAGAIVFSSEPGAYWWTGALLRNIPGMSEDLIRAAMIRANKIFYYTGLLKETAKVVRVLDSILVYWVVTRSRPIFITGDSGIPAFYHEHWEILEETSEGVLLGCESPFGGRDEDRRVRVVLLPDVTGQVRGSAVEIGPEVNTVHEARAWMFQQDPEKWKGFDKEV